MCITDAPKLGYPSMSEPSMYTQFSGMNLAVHGCGVGSDPLLLGGSCVWVPVRGCIAASVGSFCEDVYPSRDVVILVG